MFGRAEKKQKQQEKEQREKLLEAWRTGKRSSNKYHGAETINIQALINKATSGEARTNVTGYREPHENEESYAYLHIEPVDGDSFKLWFTLQPDQDSSNHHSVLAISEGLTGHQVDNIFAAWDEEAQKRGLKQYGTQNKKTAAPTGTPPAP